MFYKITSKKEIHIIRYRYFFFLFHHKDVSEFVSVPLPVYANAVFSSTYLLFFF